MRHGTIYTLPFNKLPKTIIIELVYYVVLWINSLPVMIGNSKDY